MTEVGRPFGPLARWSFGVGGVLLLGSAGWIAITEPPVTVLNWTTVIWMVCWGAAGLVFPFAVPRARSGRWRTFVVLVLVPVLAHWVLLGPVGLLAPDWVADPDSTSTRWPRTPENAVSTGVLYLVLGAILVVLLIGGRWADRRIERRRRR